MVRSGTMASSADDSTLRPIDGPDPSSLDEVERGVRSLKQHRRSIRRFIFKHGARASALFETAREAATAGTFTSENAGLADALDLIQEIGLENAWIVRAVILAHRGDP